MLRRVGVADVERRVERVDLDEPRLLERGARDVGARQPGELAIDLHRDGVDEPRVVAHQQHL